MIKKILIKKAFEKFKAKKQVKLIKVLDEIYAEIDNDRGNIYKIENSVDFTLLNGLEKQVKGDIKAIEILITKDDIKIDIFYVSESGEKLIKPVIVNI